MLKRCDRCGITLRVEGWLARRAKQGEPIRCAKCLGRRDRRGESQPRREMGCIVSALIPGDPPTPLVRHEPGLTSDALRVICDRLPAGAWVESISTYRTIERDLTGVPRSLPFGGRGADKGGANPTIKESEPIVDPWSAERQLLARIGRLDLLPARARHPGRQFKTTLLPRRPTAPTHLFGRYESW